jgi:hypothetical protein
MADEEVDPFGATASEGGPRGVVEEFSIDHRADGDAQVSQAAPTFAIGGHFEAQRGDFVSQPLRSDGGEPLRCGWDTQVAGERSGHFLGQCRRAVQSGHRVGDGPLEQRAGAGDREKSGHRPGSAGYPGDGDTGRVSAEAGDVVLDPFQCRDLIEQAAIRRSIVE